MNSTLNSPETIYIRNDGSVITDRGQCIRFDNVVNTFKVMFDQKVDAKQIKTILQAFHEVVECTDLHDNIFQIRIRTMQIHMDSDSIRNILNPFHPIATCNLILRTVLAI